MQAINITPVDLLNVLAGQEVTADENMTGQFLLVAKENSEKHLPSAMAGAIADIALGQVQLQSLVHPMKIAVDLPDWTPYQVEESFLTKEPHNWFGPEAIVIEKRFDDFTKEYSGSRDDKGGIPQSQIPKNIAEPLLIEDAYWAAYKNFVNDPDGSFAEQITPFFTK
ncbi:hypothetical protein FPFC_011430 [Fructobacillus pseudoficulneus]|uniref:Uncharacterized protein n=1 Tax=Fructobacillus pseudoficulneus TaxID=220714 RepID=A0A3F3GRA8_9LACO|nr:hypothetical protein [Fructobacillus pseudoficulneus]GAP02264.1 hypothetical protein FPFC_011430 [Fructobacillus pseudoficulneus]SEH36230.1 hypothetical protein SAMN05660469_0215 [Fructobacillus pseudoficulneus]